jgi:hypothetical protein
MTHQPVLTQEQTEIRDVLSRINGAWSKLRGEDMTAAMQPHRMSGNIRAKLEPPCLKGTALAVP